MPQTKPHISRRWKADKELIDDIEGTETKRAETNVHIDLSELLQSLKNGLLQRVRLLLQSLTAWQKVTDEPASRQALYTRKYIEKRPLICGAFWRQKCARWSGHDRGLCLFRWATPSWSLASKRASLPQQGHCVPLVWRLLRLSQSIAPWMKLAETFNTPVCYVDRYTGCLSWS